MKMSPLIFLWAGNFPPCYYQEKKNILVNDIFILSGKHNFIFHNQHIYSEYNFVWRPKLSFLTVTNEWISECAAGEVCSTTVEGWQMAWCHETTLSSVSWSDAERFDFDSSPKGPHCLK